MIISEAIGDDWVKTLTTLFIFLGTFLAIFGLFFIDPGLVGYAVVPKNPSLGKALAGSGFSLILVASIVKTEPIKKYLEKYHRRKLPEFDVTYSDELYLSFLTVPGLSLDQLKYEMECVAVAPVEKLAERINRDKFTIIHPTKEAFRKIISETYRHINYLYENQELVPEERNTKVKYMLNWVERYVDTCKHWKESVYERTWHEMGHILTRAYGLEDLPSPWSEGVAVAYGFKGLLLGTKKGRFPVERTTEQIKSRIEEYKGFPEGKESLDRVLGDFETKIEKFDPSAGDLDDLIADLDKKIDYALKKIRSK